MINNAIDPYSPKQIAALVETAGINKAQLPLYQMVTLGILAGVFIAFGAMFFTVAITNSSFGFGPTRLLGGLAFSLGLILVVIAGAELFTGNNLIVIAWADKKISTGSLLRNWLVVYISNFIGAVFCAWAVYLSGTLSIGQGAIADNALYIAQYKVELDFGEAFFRGLLCNTLVCLAVWLSMAAHSVAGKILAIVFPITAFVALGFEHSIANMYFISLGMLLPDNGISLTDLFNNLIPVTLGNIIGGSVCVALVYWLCYGANINSN